MSSNTTSTFSVSCRRILCGRGLCRIERRTSRAVLHQHQSDSRIPYGRRCVTVRPVHSAVPIPRQTSQSQPVTNNLRGANSNLETTTILAGQLDRPYPQYSGLSLGGYGCCSSTYNSLQATLHAPVRGRRYYARGLYELQADEQHRYTHELAGGQYRRGRGSAGLQQSEGREVAFVSGCFQRLIISYVLDLPFGHGKMFASNLSGAADKVVAGGESTASPPSNVVSRSRFPGPGVLLLWKVRALALEAYVPTR